MAIFCRIFIATYLQIIDYNVDIDNFNSPIKNILYPISFRVRRNNLPSHSLNFSPLIF